MYANIENDIPRIITEQVYLKNDIQYPVYGFQFMSDEELISIGIYKIHEIEPPPNFMQTGNELIWTGERVELIPLGYVLTQDQLNKNVKEIFREAVQSHIDNVARSKMYENGISLASYANSVVPEWQNEARAFISWRDTIWVFVFDKLSLIEQGEIPIPDSIEEFITTLPVIQWD